MYMSEYYWVRHSPLDTRSFLCCGTIEQKILHLFSIVCVFESSGSLQHWLLLLGHVVG